ncbi:MAG: tRNA 5-methylaminomethyl-2-thiouridine biosynthesis bifunctional protein [Alteromonadaceae bacterium]
MTDKTSLIVQKDGTPYCQRFDEMYFDSNTGYQQSENIFIHTNNIIQQLVACENDTFTIAETGFGTGLTFLLTLKAYVAAQQLLKINNNQKKLCKLHFISVEKYPLTKEEISQSLSIFPEFKALIAPLLSQYPRSLLHIDVNDEAPYHQLVFLSQQVTLRLYFCDATLALKSVASPKSGVIDTWYLDGFSPNKNPDMWSTALFEQISRLSKEQASLSTYTVTENVKRQLINIGFRIKIIETLSQQKQILKAKFQRNKIAGKSYQIRPQINKPQQVGIIGGGIASACAAYLLTRQGVKVTLYCQESTVAQGASSNAIGALYPLLHQQKDDMSEFYQQAFWRAKQLYQELLDDGFEFSHQWCGLLDVAYKDSIKKHQQRFTEIAAWPKALIHSVDKEQATTIAKVPLAHGGLFMPEAGWIAPQELVKQLFSAADKTHRLTIKNNLKIKEIKQNSDDSWQLKTDTTPHQEAILIVCGGAESIKINTIEQLPLTSVRGQITSMASNDQISNLATVICHKGYLTPEDKGIHCIGATFDKNSFDTQVQTEHDLYNLRMLNDCLPGLTDWHETDVVSAKARLRCMTPDHLPMVGAMPNLTAHVEHYAHLRKDKNWKFTEPATMINNLYVMTGLGARGLCSAPLISDILVADICGTPYPVDNKTLFNLSPNRFIIRDLIKRKI